MSFESVDQLQKALTENVFHYAKDSKKAAGRALGTIVEIITFYLLKSWGLNNAIGIEKRIPEFGYPEITHNVEYSLYPVFREIEIELKNDGNSITPTKILRALEKNFPNLTSSYQKTNNVLLNKHGIMRNACTIGISENRFLVASITNVFKDKITISVAEQDKRPYSIFECKRVGVEEGTKKGPQTIEKAKQGAYVAKTVSSLQKIRLENGQLYGIIYKNNKVFMSKPYHELLYEVIKSNDMHLLRHFILTVGVVSNHGNWFTAEDHNKELKVLAQSYDWLIFLTDQGITEFIKDTIFSDDKEVAHIKQAFYNSYSGAKGKNQFTKVQMNFMADRQLLRYFYANQKKINRWFNIISPINSTLDKLKKEIFTLKTKDWSKLR
ncbi:MAG: hypothetical protein ACTSWR_11205 [Candidatus Helarchaeota archaeon]